MAKISPVSIKYMIHATFESEGPLEKPDVIGAIFGQTEGLLGADLEMRELQKEGKIGRIEVDLNNIEGRTIGEILVPTALDKSETTIIAATLETIERIGPTESKIKVTKVEDVRGNKRDYIISRAKELLGNLETSGNVGIAKTLREESRISRVQEYGSEKLPAGDLSGEEIIVVEGRADVLNLLKNRVNNVIGMDGAKLPKTISELGKEKEITLFIDGDRGGKLIAKNVSDNANISYIATAPDGKEVEELTGKEILISLRKKIPAPKFLGRTTASKIMRSVEDNFEGDIKKSMNDKYLEIRNKKKAMLVDSKFETIKESSLGELISNVKRTKKKIFAIIIDGTATKKIVEVCDDKGIQNLGAKNFSYLGESKINLVSL
jgi:DNA primase